MERHTHWTVALVVAVLSNVACGAESQPADGDFRGADADSLGRGADFRGADFRGVDHSAFDAILEANVRNERVDYLTIRKKHYQDLTAYLDRLSRVDVDELSRDERLAFYINLYNAAMIRAVVERFRADYSPEDDDFRVFKEKSIRLGAGKISLDQIENKIVRPRFKDARIHVALVCGARSCPPLLARAYRGDDLDAVLEANMKRFVANDPFRNPIDLPRRQLRLSALFDWYADDFGGKGGIAAYVDKYHDQDLSRFKVSFLDYSWKLNIAPGLAPGTAAGRWVQITRATGDAKVGEVYEVVEQAGDQLVLDAPLAGRRLTVKRQATAPFVVEESDPRK